MPTNPPNTVIAAQTEIVTIVLECLRTGKVSWQNDGHRFFGYLTSEIRVVLDGSAPLLVESANWDQFLITQGNQELINWYFPSLTNTVQGRSICPEKFRPIVEEIFKKLQGELVDTIYGPALRELRSLKKSGNESL